MVCEALIQAQASPQVINAMVGAYEAWERAKRPRGRQRKYADTMALGLGRGSFLSRRTLD